MTVILERDTMVVRLGLWEKLAAVRWRDLRLARAAMCGVERSIPPSTLKHVRAPGTYVPGLIKAGSYYTSRGREFWFVTRGGRAHPITVSLTGSLALVVLGFATEETPDLIEAWWDNVPAA
jgi:hypothetical protein